jgi:Zn-dependent protease with chaperone function
VGVRLRAGVGVVLLVGFFVLVFGVIGVCVFGAVYGLTTGQLGGGITLATIAVFVAGGVGTALWKVLTDKVEPRGARADRADQPELWRMIDELAIAADTRGPDEVWIVPEVNASVWERGQLLGLRDGRRYMSIGLPLLGGLSVAELRAVLGHELGHYSHGHTKMTAMTYRATATMARTLNHMEGWLRLPLSWYVSVYLLVARSANRAQELQADEAAVRAAGKQPTRSMLGKLNALDAAWDHYGDSYVSLARPAERSPQLLFGFHDFLTDDLRHQQLVEAQAALLDAEPASRYDSHPPMRARIAAIDVLAEPDRAVDDRPAWELLNDSERTVPLLESELLANDLGPRASWPEIVALGTANVVKQNAKTLAQALSRHGYGNVRTGDLDEVFAVLERGEGQVMVAQVAGELPAADRLPMFARTFADTIAYVLVEAGQASFVLDWADTWRLRLADGEDLPDLLARATAALTDPAAVRPLRDWLTALPTPAA